MDIVEITGEDEEGDTKLRLSIFKRWILWSAPHLVNAPLSGCWSRDDGGLDEFLLNAMYGTKKQ